MSFPDVIGHERPQALLQAAISRCRVAHAYLFQGEESIGKRLVATRFAQALNCESDRGPSACGACRSCRQIEAGTHPDVLLVRPDPERANPQIKIEQIRELEQQVIYRPLIGRIKCVLIDEADRLTLAAANALLKTLEEPPAHSLFLLITSRPSALPATIRSRCQIIPFAVPAAAQVQAALTARRALSPADARLLTMITHARIGHALEANFNEMRARRGEFRALLAPSALKSITHVLNAAEALYKSGQAQQAMEWLAQWLRDLLLVRVGADPAYVFNLDQMPDLQEMARSIAPDTLLDLLSDIDAIEHASARNLNLHMALETLLLRLRDAVQS
jgi:DNA polymerase-3 subunit delta'